MNVYRTIQAESPQSLYTEKRSRFIGCAFPAETPEQALSAVAEVRSRYNDARHVCWAYRLGTDDEPVERSNDDGEPSGSAGKPILGQLISRDLRNVVVAVVRYYGGVNLGTGGLAVAYKTAAGEALDKTDIREVTLYKRYRLRFPFDLINPVMMLLRDTDAEMNAPQDADAEGHIWQIRVPNARNGYFEEKARQLYRLSAEAQDETQSAETY